MDLALDEITHDLQIVDGDLVIYTGLDATAQRLKIKLRFFLGEWFLNESVGIPYWESIFVKNPNLAVVRSIFRKAILSDKAVTSLNQFDFTLSENRAARLTFKADTTDGPLVFDEEFII